VSRLAAGQASSPSEVKKHLSRVYAKVDVDGWADLAAQVARRAL
jgi:hypothetical protein